MAGYKIDRVSLRQYFENDRDRITAMEGWQHKTDEIVIAVHSIARDIPLLVIRKAFVRAKKGWMSVDDDAFLRNFEET